MNTRELISEQYSKILTEGRQIMSRAGWDGKELQSWPPMDDFTRFCTQAANLIRRSCGDDSDHYRDLRELNSKHGPSPSDFPYYVGIVEAAQRDFESGLLFDMRSLIAAELLGDFIEQAEVLLDAGFFHPAASLAGAVLEDSLRKLCERQGVPVPESTKIDRLNSELAKAGIYSKLIQKRITAMADIRNNADHGHFDRFNKDDVEDMLKWIRRFSADHLR